MGQPSPNSAKIRLGHFFLRELYGPQPEDFKGFPEETLAEVAGIVNHNNLNHILWRDFVGMFSVKKGFFMPNYDEFGGQDHFLQDLEELVSTFEGPVHKEWRRSGGPESYVHSASFGHQPQRRR